MRHVRIETVKELKSNQVIFPDWMQKAVEGLTDDDKVRVTVDSFPFRTYVININKNFS